MSSSTHEGSRIEVRGLTKHFGKVVAVQDLTFTVEPGRITGFLGPNGAGKTTTLRMLLSLVTPTSGTATIGGVRYTDLPQPQRVVGAALEASSFHPGRNARNHLRVLGQTCGMGAERADQLLELVGLGAAAKRRVGGFSMGMRQRLGLAGALVGDPSVLILDEPANGLDPEGIRWLRGFLRALAAEGRTVLVSSHMLSEVQQTVDDVVVISQGRAVKQSTLAELEAEARAGVLVRAADPAALAALAERAGWDREPGEHGALLVRGTSAPEVGRAAFGAGVEVHELRPVGSDLESMFFRLVSPEYVGSTPGVAVPVQQPVVTSKEGAR
jgi:ABC-2 type transport system ATP-binding protein